MSFAILTDTSANLPTPLLEKHGITVVPFSYSYDGAEHICLDTETFDGAAYYGAMRKGTVVTTSLVNPGRFIAAARPLLAAGKDILFVGMSSGISGSFGSAKLAAGDLREEFPGREIQLIDTLGASLGEGILVLRAIEMRESGASLSETAAALRDMRWRMYQIFTVDDIMYLRRTGRLSNAKAIVASVLHIKPLLKGNEEGRIVAVDKIRGRRGALPQICRRPRNADRRHCPRRLRRGRGIPCLGAAYRCAAEGDHDRDVRARDRLARRSRRAGAVFPWRRERPIKVNRFIYKERKP